MIMKNINLQEAEEQLKRVLLMMKYDSGKTLTENKELIYLIKEQKENCSNLVDKNTVKTKAEKVGDLVRDLTTAFIGLYKVEDKTKQIFDIIKEMSTKNYFNDITNTCENSLKQLKKEFEVYHRGWFSKSKGLEGELTDLINDESRMGKSADAKTYLEQSLNILKENLDEPVKKTEDNKKEEGNKKEPIKRTYVACSGTDEQPFKKLCYEKDPIGPLHKVQGCLGLTADGKFWEKTEKALIEKTGKPTFTISDVDTICKSSQQTPEQPKPKSVEAPQPEQLALADIQNEF